MEFTRLSDVTLVEETIDTANVLIEENGEIKRVPKTEVGGTGFPTAIIKSSDYDEAITAMLNPAEPSSVKTADFTDEVTFSCTNMTFEEAYEIMSNGEILNVIFMLYLETPCNVQGITMFSGIVGFGVPCILLIEMFENIRLFWSADGISTHPPGSPR